MNIGRLEKSLLLDRMQTCPVYEWLTESYRRPAVFWEEFIIAHNKAFTWPPKSRLFQNYDFYHDIVVRNRESKIPALTWYDSYTGWREINYTDLEKTVNAKAASWLRQGVSAGQSICLVCQIGENWLVSMLAAFKTGLTLSFVFPRRKTILHKKLEILNPDYIVADDIYYRILKPYEERILTSGSAEKGSPVSGEYSKEYSHAYSSGSVLLRIFDPADSDFWNAREVISDAAYLNPIRDGALALGVRPGQRVCAPGFYESEVHPGLILSTLLNGGTYVHINVEDLEKNLSLISEMSFKTIGITQKVRNLFLRKNVVVSGKWFSWFKNPFESGDLTEWQDFVETAGLKESYSHNLRMSAVVCGCSLFSTKRKGQCHNGVFPFAGSFWSLSQIVDPEMPTDGDFGILSVNSHPGDNGDSIPLPFILVKSTNEWLIAGPTVAGRSGRYYPADEVLETVQDKIPGMTATIVALPASGVETDTLFVFVFFSGGRETGNQADLIREVLEVIEGELGDEFIPDRFQFFDLSPRRDSEGNLDHEWCRDQYLTGGLFRKSKLDIFRSLSRLREYVASA